MNARSALDFVEAFDKLSPEVRELMQRLGYERDRPAGAALVEYIIDGVRKLSSENTVSADLPGFLEDEQVYADLIILVMHEAEYRNLKVSRAVLAKLATLSGRDVAAGKFPR